LIRLEVAPALPELAVNAYWNPTVERFANPMIEAVWNRRYVDHV